MVEGEGFSPIAGLFAGESVAYDARTRRVELLTLRFMHASTIIGLSALLLLTGCVERTIHITSEPPGALVYLNDEEIGRTPCEVRFLHYGTYDLRMTLDGYEPYSGPAQASPPPYDMLGPDLVAELLPVTLTSDIRWHIDLHPVNDDPEALLDRGRQLRARLQRSFAGEDELATALEPADEPEPAEVEQP